MIFIIDFFNNWTVAKCLTAVIPECFNRESILDCLVKPGNDKRGISQQLIISNLFTKEPFFYVNDLSRLGTRSSALSCQEELKHSRCHACGGIPSPLKLHWLKIDIRDKMNKFPRSLTGYDKLRETP